MPDQPIPPKLESFDEQLDTYLAIWGLELPDFFRQELRRASTSERIQLLRARGIYSLPYSREAIDAYNNLG